MTSTEPKFVVSVVTELANEVKLADIPLMTIFEGRFSTQLRPGPYLRVRSGAVNLKSGYVMDKEDDKLVIDYVRLGQLCVEEDKL